MNSVVIYGSRHGNTEKIAYAIAAALRRHGPARVTSAESAASAISKDVDLVVIGGPTEGHQLTPPLVQFFDDLEPGLLSGRLAAAFDTRLKWPRWLSGSAAGGAHKRLLQAGAQTLAAPESFFVTGKRPELVPGELTRASAWADVLAARAERRAATPAHV